MIGDARNKQELQQNDDNDDGGREQVFCSVVIALSPSIHSCHRLQTPIPSASSSNLYDASSGHHREESSLMRSRLISGYEKQTQPTKCSAILRPVLSYRFGQYVSS